MAVTLTETFDNLRLKLSFIDRTPTIAKGYGKEYRTNH